jgi:excinuclease ABC subunit B
VAILDADKEGFLRSSTSLIQTIGRAARNVSGQVHMYADKITPSMAQAIEETDRRREKQVAYNLERGVDPQPLRKKIVDILEGIYREAEDSETADLISQMNEQMLAAARELQFEVAARLRDELTELKKELRQLDAAHA